MLWFAKALSHKPVPTMRELEYLSRRVLERVRRGGRLPSPFGPSGPLYPSVHRQLIDDMGGTGEWVAMMRDLDQADREFKW